MTREGFDAEEHKTPAKRHGFTPDCQFERVSGFGSLDLKARSFWASSETTTAEEGVNERMKKKKRGMKEAMEVVNFVGNFFFFMGIEYY